jgi:hypothetical protein
MDYVHLPGAPEIEITPEMIKAGCRELSRYRYDESNDEEIVAAIFLAMNGFGSGLGVDALVWRHGNALRPRFPGIARELPIALRTAAPL